LIQGDIIPHPATYVRRQLYETAGVLDESLKYAMDYDMWLRLGRLAEPLQVQEFLSVYRAHSGSTTHANLLASLGDEYAVRKRYLPSNPVVRVDYALRHFRRRRAVRCAMTA